MRRLTFLMFCIMGSVACSAQVKHGKRLEKNIAIPLMQHALDSTRSLWGCVALMEVNSGYCRLVNITREPRENLALTDSNYVCSYLFEPGSVFKTATLLTLLDEAKLNLSNKIDCEGGTYRLKSMTLSDKRPLGVSSLEEIYLNGSNIGFAKLIEKSYSTAPNRYYQHIKKLGFDPGCDFNSHDGRCSYTDNRDSTWREQFMIYNSCGYQLAVAPIHLLSFYNAIANGGKLIKPRYFDDDAKVILEKRIASPSSLSQTRRLMTQKGKEVGFDNVALYGGSSQQVRNTSDSREYISTVVGFFPADAPKYTIIICIKGSTVTTKLAYDLLAELVREIKSNNYEYRNILSNFDCSCDE